MHFQGRFQIAGNRLSLPEAPFPENAKPVKIEFRKAVDLPPADIGKGIWRMKICGNLAVSFEGAVYLAKSVSFPKNLGGKVRVACPTRA